MFSRTEWTFFWFLLVIFIVKGKADSSEEDTNAYCDDDYLSKYVVTKTLLDPSGEENTNSRNSNYQNHNDYDQSIDELPHGNKDADENASNVSDESAKKKVNCNKVSKNARSMRKIEARQFTDKEKMRSKPIMKKHPTKVPKKYRPLTISIKTEIDIDLLQKTIHSQESNIISFDMNRRKKRETDGPWPGELTCRSNRRVIGGNKIKSIEELPYMVYIDSGCGGSVISESWILSASHCVSQESPDYIYAGSLKLQGGCRYKIEKIFVHPKYNKRLFVNDIALLKLYEPLVFSPAIKPIPLAKEKPKIGDCGIVSGWGTETLNGSMVYDMKKTMLPIVEQKRCNIFLYIGDGQFCAGFRETQTDACQGDSGGPFVVNGILTGIVSYGYKCAVRETPGVYVDVAFYRKWIESIAGI